jgi:hypothetical protein
MTKRQASSGYTHFWHVRGRGFSDKEWRAVISVATEIIANAKDSGILVAGPDGLGEPVIGARSIDLNGLIGQNAQPFHLPKYSDPAWGQCRTNYLPYDEVVVSILTAAKKIAPDKIEISSDGSREVFRRMFAMNKKSRFEEGKTVDVAEYFREIGNEEAAEQWEKYEGKVEDLPKKSASGSQNASYLKEIPASKRTKILKHIANHYGISLMDAMKEVTHPDAEDLFEYASSNRSLAMEILRDFKDQGLKISSINFLRSAKIKTASKLSKDQIEEVKKEMVPNGVPVRFLDGGESMDIITGQKTGRGSNVMHQIVYWNFTKETSKKIAKWLGVRPVFSKSASGDVKTSAAKGPKPKAPPPTRKRREARFEKGKSVDVAKWLRDNGHTEAADEWEKYDGKVEDLPKSATTNRQSSRAKLASKLFPTYKAAQIKVAEKWIQEAIQNPGRVRRFLGIPEGEEIPMDQLNQAIERVKGSGDQSLLSALLLAKRLKQMDR